MQFSKSGVTSVMSLLKFRAMSVHTLRPQHLQLQQVTDSFGGPNFDLPDKGTDLLTHSVNTDFPICKVYYSWALCTRHATQRNFGAQNFRATATSIGPLFNNTIFRPNFRYGTLKSLQLLVYDVNLWAKQHTYSYL